MRRAGENGRRDESLDQTDLGTFGDRRSAAHNLERARRGIRARLDPEPSCPKRFVLATILHRSEEHTSELQSLAYLVCRLLLEKKKMTIKTTARIDTARALRT